MLLEYESPIKAFVTQMQTEMDNHLLYTVTQSVGYDISIDELIKALQYDRHQYEKGVSDTKLNYLAVDTLLNRCKLILKEIQSLHTISDKNSIKINDLLSEINEYIK
jgi:hypothetical protein